VGLDGRYIAFDDKGKPWGVLDFGGDQMNAAVIEDAPNVTLRREFAEYLIGEVNLTTSTAFTYEQSFRRFERWFNDRDVTTLTVDDIRLFLRKSDYHPATKNSTLVAIKALHRWGMLEQHPWANPAVLEIRGPKHERNARPILEPHEAATLLESCSAPNEFRAVWFGLLAGMRVSESARIGEEEWLVDRFRFLGKGRKMRDVPIHPLLVDKRTIILSKRPSMDTLKHVCRSVSFVTGIDFTSHTLRRTFSRTMRRAGAPREVPAATMGHAPATVNEAHYDPVEWEEKVEWMPKVEYPLTLHVGAKR
jgi:site-specific recombinase XerD